MRLKESEFIKSLIEDRINFENPIKTCINLGCGNINQLLIKKPWINKNLFEPLKSKNIKIINLDTFKFESVDYVADLSDSGSLDFVKTTQTPRLLILGNVLEHVPSESRGAILNNIFQAMDSGDYLIISTPYEYPYHADPIDTMFRPSPAEVRSLAPLEWINLQIIECGSFYDEFKRMNFLKKIRKLLKPFWIFQNPKKWLENHRLLFLFKNYQILVAIGIKK
jgi:hypothetical protein